jgi:hypothetical protein
MGLAEDNTSSVLKSELQMLEGIMVQNPETGALTESSSYLGQYTNRVFGAPFQLMDSVDKKFKEINPFLGNEYLRNFTLNSPILHIRPGMPQYTGGTSSSVLAQTVKNLYLTGGSSGMSTVQALISGLAEGTVFRSGSKLQKRMFSFRETYYDYMQHVNYMCRSMATFLNLTDTSRYPTGTFTSYAGTSADDGWQEFSSIKWENYRMMANSTVKTPWEYLKDLVAASPGSSTALNTLQSGIVSGLLTVTTEVVNIVDNIKSNGLGGGILQTFKDSFGESISGNMQNKIAAVEFVVEPVAFDETYTNQTKESTIASSINSIRDSVGSEIGFITNSSLDDNVIAQAAEFLGSGLDSIATSINDLTSSNTGGFVTNLFSGALGAIKGQKMIYPKIYDYSQSSMNYQFTVNLTSPYGDVYNYYMNIVVPLMHLLALVSPRLVTSNSVASPYLVQAYVPGMCTCNMGIIQSMQVTKNKDSNHVSVNGFPLDVKVTFTIEELYNAMSISPGNDPASFLFNDTLNDYLANAAGLIPSIDTYTRQRKATFEALAEYFRSGEYLNDYVSETVEEMEDRINPFR